MGANEINKEYLPGSRSEKLSVRSNKDIMGS